MYSYTDRLVVFDICSKELWRRWTGVVQCTSGRTPLFVMRESGTVCERCFCWCTILLGSTKYLGCKQLVSVTVMLQLHTKRGVVDDSQQIDKVIREWFSYVQRVESSWNMWRFLDDYSSNYGQLCGYEEHAQRYISASSSMQCQSKFSRLAYLLLCRLSGLQCVAVYQNAISAHDVRSTSQQRKQTNEPSRADDGEKETLNVITYVQSVWPLNYRRL